MGSCDPGLDLLPHGPDQTRILFSSFSLFSLLLAMPERRPSSSITLQRTLEWLCSVMNNSHSFNVITWMETIKAEVTAPCFHGSGLSWSRHALPLFSRLGSLTPEWCCLQALQPLSIFMSVSDTHKIHILYMLCKHRFGIGMAKWLRRDFLF